jgi:hypothetical protein
VEPEPSRGPREPERPRAQDKGLHQVHPLGRRHKGRLTSNRMLKKPLPVFFNDGLYEVNSSKPYKLLNFLSLAIWQYIHGLL